MCHISKVLSGIILITVIVCIINFNNTVSGVLLLAINYIVLENESDSGSSHRDAADGVVCLDEKPNVSAAGSLLD